jgi:hypothetical protein
MSDDEVDKLVKEAEANRESDKKKKESSKLAIMLTLSSTNQRRLSKRTREVR